MCALTEQVIFTGENHGFEQNIIYFNICFSDLISLSSSLLSSHSHLTFSSPLSSSHLLLPFTSFPLPLLHPFLLLTPSLTSFFPPPSFSPSSHFLPPVPSPSPQTRTPRTPTTDGHPVSMSTLWPSSRVSGVERCRNRHPYSVLPLLSLFLCVSYSISLLLLCITLLSSILYCLSSPPISPLPSPVRSIPSIPPSPSTPSHLTLTISTSHPVTFSLSTHLTHFSNL